MTGTAYATSAEMAEELGAFPGYKKNAKALLRVVRNPRRAAHGDADGYDGLSVTPVPLRHATCPQPELATAAMAACDDASELGRRPGVCHHQATVIGPRGKHGPIRTS